MAEIRIEESPVTRVFHDGKGAEVTESFKLRDGETGSARYACWFESPHGLTVGDVVTVTGRLGVKVEEWVNKQNEVKHSAKVSVNGAQLVGWPVSGAVGSSEPVSEEPWATSPLGGYDDTEAPF